MAPAPSVFAIDHTLENAPIHYEGWNPDPSKRVMFDAAKTPIVIAKGSTGMILWMVADPEVVQDIFVGKNALMDKEQTFKIMMTDALGEALLVQETNDSWRKKRKASAHAFYKERMTHMLETLKDLSSDMVEQISGSISGSGSCEVDIAHEFEKLFSRNIITVSFGEDVSN